MVKYVKLTPVTRVNGQLGVTTRVDDTEGDVTNAYVHGDTFRGIEKLLLKRDPKDAPVISSRAGGLNNFTNRHVALRNIENAAGWSFPMAQAANATYGGTTIANGRIDQSAVPGSSGFTTTWLDKERSLITGSPTGTKMKGGAQLARNIVEIISQISSHLFNVVCLVGPDYKALIDGSGSGINFDDIYEETIVAQRIFHEVLGFLGGKSPNQMSAVPGGFSRSLTGPMNVSNTDMAAIKTLLTKRVHIGGADPSSGGYSLLNLSDGGNKGLDEQRNLSGGADWFWNRFKKFLDGLIYALDTTNGVDAESWGYGPNNFVCGGAYDIVRGNSSTNKLEVQGDQYFRAGVVIDSTGSRTRYNLDPTQLERNGWMTIYEDITSAKYPIPDQYTGEPKCGGTAGYEDNGYPGNNNTHPLTASYDLKLPDGSDRYVYTWFKAARVYNGSKTFTVEAGPLARLVVNGVDPDITNGGTWTRANLFGNAWRSSTANRIWARVQELMLLIDMLIGSNYSGENTTNGYLNDIDSNGCLLSELDHAWFSDGNASGKAGDWGSSLTDGGPLPDTQMIDTPATAWENLSSKLGCGCLDAPEGATSHFCEISNGTLSQYQQVGGTTWNGGGRDLYGNPGPIEWSIMGMQKDESSQDFDDTNAGSGKYELDLSPNNPIVERVLRISYKLRTGAEWRTYYAYDEPKYNGSDKGQIVGQGLKATSEIDYSAGTITLEFEQHSEWGYDHVKDVQLDRYGWANTPVTIPSWGSNNGYSSTSQPNPINILRTIRSFDPCVNSGVQLFNKDGKVKKFEVLTSRGWEVNDHE